MGLTSTKVLVLAVVVAVLLFAATIWLWPRLSGRTWRSVLGRIGMMLATQLALFAAIGLAANKSFLFYGSWADLFGQEDQMGVVVDHASGGGSKEAQLIGTQAMDVPGGNKPAVGGQIQEVRIEGRASKIVSPAYVYLPPEYFQPEFKKKQFPATVVLTGYPGIAMNLIKGLRYPQTALMQARAGKAQPMIMVLMRPTVAPPRDTNCVDIPGGPQTETFFAKDLPQAISASYRVGTKPQNWGFMGNSTGGYCALKIAMAHPDRFAAGAGLSPDYKAADDPTTGDLFGGDEDLKKRANLIWALDHLPAPKTSLLVTTSKKGESNKKPTAEFISKVKPPTKVSSITLNSGGHNFNTWKREIPAVIEWMSKKLTA
ncbi:alpha/beta hydrolase [Streptomyces sp. NPDC087440]|uniref:alpha/beta hydrolase n=1 Tax=Streptomyces sp. NPDC087440 TaxID=3365790 RepID=UPI00381706B4